MTDKEIIERLKSRDETALDGNDVSNLSALWGDLP